MPKKPKPEKPGKGGSETDQPIRIPAKPGTPK